jgi:subtilisin family serine protease
MEKEYVVSLNKGVDYDKFWDEIENLSQDDGFVPSRRVDIVNNRDGSTRSCHYSLTDEEAKKLRDDPRVYCVEIPPDQRDDLIMMKCATQVGNFDKPSGSTGDNLNWGLIRCIKGNNIYGTGTETSENYKYLLDGTGVDVVIQDSGLEVNHPEFQDADGNSRVQQIDWFTASGLSGTQSANFYRDFDGHGTHCAGIAAGKTFGWAKNARIYAVKVAGLEGSGDSGTGISVSNCFDVIKLWHRNKPVNPVTGYKRPTVVNMSWGYSTNYAESTANRVFYRGTLYNLTTPNDRWTAGVMPLSSNGGITYIANLRVGTVDVDVEELIDEGVHVCIAAGNNYFKIDVPGGTDYDNYILLDDDTEIYYHRGTSPYSLNALNVGNINSTAYNANTDKKSDTSETGPGVDIYSPGDSIKSACSNTNIRGGVSYYADAGFKQTSIGGTSMASPQVAGVTALLLQMNPNISPADLKANLVRNSVKNVIYDTGVDNDWSTSFTSLKGGNNRFLLFPIGVSEDKNTAGSLEINNLSITYT